MASTIEIPFTSCHCGKTESHSPTPLCKFVIPESRVKTLIDNGLVANPINGLFIKPNGNKYIKVQTMKSIISALKCVRLSFKDDRVTLFTLKPLTPAVNVRNVESNHNVEIIYRKKDFSSFTMTKVDLWD